MDTQPNPPPNPLTNLEADIRAHWAKHLPQAWELVREKYAFLPAEPEPDEAE